MRTDFSSLEILQEPDGTAEKISWKSEIWKTLLKLFDGQS